MLGKTVRMSVAVLVGALAMTAAVNAGPAFADAPYGSNSAGAIVSTVVAGQVTEQEAADLAFMREEEKLAHDVYVQLYELWGQPTFNNIAKSEQTHTDAIMNLLDRYGIADPSAGKAAGEFSNADLQALYNTLVAQGSQSLAAALRVGAAIEEIDILDLQERIAQTDKADIELVYANLEKGSENHLRSFTTTLKRLTGETYQPQYLSPAAFNAIVGGGNGGGRRGR
jgi:hypothetical protein